MDSYGAIRLVHILAASLWFGGAVYQVAIIGPTLMQAGPAAGGFLATLAKRGGIGRYFAVAGAVTILAGGYLLGKLMGADGAPGAFSTERGHLWLTLGAIVAILAFLHGMAANMPTERKWIALTRSLQGPPTAAQQAQMQAYGMKLGRNGAISAGLIALAMLLMLLARVLA